MTAARPPEGAHLSFPVDEDFEVAEKMVGVDMDTSEKEVALETVTEIVEGTTANPLVRLSWVLFLQGLFVFLQQEGGSPGTSGILRVVSHGKSGRS